MDCLALPTDSRNLVRLKKLFGPFWNVFFFFFDSVCLAFRFSTFSNISVHSNTMRVLRLLEIDWTLAFNQY